MIGGRDRRTLVIAVCVSGSAWLLLRGLPDAVTSLNRLEDQAAIRADLLGRSSARVARLPHLSDSLAALSQVAEALPRLLLGGGDPAAARNDLMRSVREATEGRPITFVGFSPSELDESAGPLSRTGIVAEVQSDFRGLLELVRALDEDPAVGVDVVEMRSEDPDNDLRMEVLSATIGVFGWFLPATSTTEAAAADSVLQAGET